MTLKNSRLAFSLSIVLVSILLLLSGCGVSRTATSGGVRAYPTKSKRELVRAYEALTPRQVTDAKGYVEINLSGRPRRSDIRWTHVRGGSFILSVRPMGLIEIARITATDQRLLVLNRMEKEAYALDNLSSTLRSLGEELGLPLSPDLLKSIVRQEPFTAKATGAEALKEMGMRTDRDRYLFDSSTVKGYSVEHQLDGGARLLQTVLKQGGVPLLQVRYSDHETSVAGVRPFARRISIEEIKGARTLPVAEISFSQLQDIPSQTPSFEVPQSYRMLDVTEMIKKLMRQ